MAVVELVMPRMGESIIEATIIGWLKEEGDRIEIEDTVLEVATDKVDSEVPSPVAGVLKKILHQKDEVVAVGKALALIETEEEIYTKEEKVEEQPAEKEELIGELAEPVSEKVAVSAPEPAVAANEITSETKSFKSPIPLERKSLSNKIPSIMEGRFFSPLVRNIARAEGINPAELASLEGTGEDGRVTKFDLLNYIDDKKAGRISDSNIIQESKSPESEQIRVSNANIQQTRTAEPIHDRTSKVVESEITTNSGDEVIELTRMRKVIADHMMNSLSTSAHVSSFVEADATRLVTWRNRVKDEYLANYGEKLTLSPLFTEAVIQALREYPRINASLSGDQLIVKKSLNIGIATAMQNGNLIVPVIKNAGHLNLHGLAKALNDVTSRARNNKLKPDEIQGGTFTISNIGTFGNIMGTPIINQPQLAILALGAIKKKPVIQETPEGDIIAIRHMMFLSLSFDHRVIDGYLGGVFLNRIAHYIENFDVNRPI